MPYIPPARRRELDSDVDYEKTPGELNYSITNLIVSYLDETKCTYADYNEVIGVLECAKLELYRRMVAPYEDTKMKENGDVY